MTTGAVWLRSAKWKGQEVICSLDSLVSWAETRLLPTDESFLLLNVISLGCGVCFCISGAVSVFSYHLIH